jgi:protein-S-isoprenylcysteine O-methyltransferase Ste14
VLWTLAPLVDVATVLVAGVVWRVWWHHRRYGLIGVHLFRSRHPIDRIRDVLLVLFFCEVTAGAVLAAMGRLPVMGILGRVPQVDGAFFRIAGAVLTSFGVLGLVIGQGHLGRSWGIGVDRTMRPGLRTNGLFGVCRNPIYVSFWFWALGYVLLLPTWMSLVAFVVFMIVLRSYVVEEEKHLARAYGEAYLAYQRRVGRFFPRIGLTMVP